MMKRSRAKFKLALRQCKRSEKQINADNYATSLSHKNITKFWNDIGKDSSNGVVKYVTTVGGASGDKDICEMWRGVYNNLYNCVPSSNDKLECLDNLNTLGFDSYDVFNISLHDVVSSIRAQKTGKSAGPDGLSMEAFLYASNYLALHLTWLFNMFLIHSYVPSAFCLSILIPIVKNKTGDLTDPNNYRAIALSTAMSKIFEYILLQRIENVIENTEQQFGFKKKHSTTQCTYILKQCISYYRNRGSQVFTCFLDATKAFDRLNY